MDILKSLPPEVIYFLVGVAATLVLQYLRSQGIRLPIIEAILSRIAGPLQPPAPAPTPTPTDPPLPPIGQGGLLELLRRLIRDELKNTPPAPNTPA